MKLHNVVPRYSFNTLKKNSMTFITNDFISNAGESSFRITELRYKKGNKSDTIICNIHSERLYLPNPAIIICNLSGTMSE